MKKILVLALTMVLGLSMNAQSFGIGAKVGYGMSDYVLNFDKPDGSKMANGLNFGIVGEMDLGGVAGRLDISYIQMGSDFYKESDVAGMIVMSDLQTDVQYIQVGVAAKKAFGPVYAYGGPYLGYAFKNVTKGEITLDGVGGEIEIDNYENILDGSERDFYSKIDYGVYGGAGVNIKGIFVEVYAGIGIMNFMNTSSDEYYDIQDRAIQINDDGLDARDENFRYTKGSTAVEEPSQNNVFFGVSAGYLFGF